MSKNTIFLDKTGHDLTDDELKEIMNKHGDVKSIRLLNNRKDLDGKAWVEYQSENEAVKIFEKLKDSGV